MPEKHSECDEPLICKIYEMNVTGALRITIVIDDIMPITVNIYSYRSGQTDRYTFDNIDEVIAFLEYIRAMLG